MATPRLGAPELSTSQASKEATINETFYWLDAASMGGLKVLDRDLATPPGSPAQGDCYIMPAAPAGAWSLASEDDIAIYIGTAWEIRTPQEGWEAWVVDEAVKVAFSSGAWGIIGTFDGAAYVLLAGSTMTGDLIVPTEAYGVGWNGSNEVPTKDAVYDKIETLAGSIPGAYTDEQAQDAVGTILIDSSTIDFTYNDGAPSITASVISSAVKPTESLIIACSDETTALTAGTAKVTFRMPYAFTLSAVRASVTTAPTGSVLTVDINESGTTILSTKLTIDASEKTSTTAATAAVISDSSLADDAEMTIDIDGVGSTIAGAGLKVYLIGART